MGFRAGNWSGFEPTHVPTRGYKVPFSFFLLLVLIMAFAGCAPTLKKADVSEEMVKAEQEKQRKLAFTNLIKKQERIFGVSYPLLVSAAELCKNHTQSAFGFTLHDKKKYKKVFKGKYAKVAAEHFDLGDGVSVRYSHPDLPAAQAGLRAGDRIITIQNKPLDGLSASDAMKRIHELKLMEKDKLILRIGRDGREMELTISPVSACDYAVKLSPVNRVNALADGSNVIIFAGMVRFAERDEELSLVVGHEIAHNALDHRTKKVGNYALGTVLDIIIVATTGVDTGGVFGNLGGIAFSKSFEAEADYMGLYITARAGFDITDAADFWRRMAMEFPANIEKHFTSSHPSTAERFTAIEKAVEEIEGKREQGKPLIPEKKK